MNDTQDLIVLQIIKDSHMPVGALYLSENTSISQASVGRVLLQLEKKGFLKKVSNKGRLLTPEGELYLSQHQQLEDKLRTAKSIIETVESLSKQKLYEVLEVRIALEAHSAEQASCNSTPDDIMELERIILDQHYNLSHGGIGSDQDLQLHLKIAQMSKNKTLSNMIILILTQDNVHTKFSLVAPHITSTQISQHKEIVKYIKQKDGEGAKNAMILHLKHVMKDVKKYYKT